jgi:flagellar hook-associated protein 3 FlgL
MTINSFSRLGTANSYTSAVNNITARQDSLSNLQQSLTSGLKINHPGDDPVGAAAAERAITRMARIQSDQKALGLQTDAITSAESTLGSAVTALQTFRQLVVSAGNPSMTPADRQTVAQQLTSLRDQVFALSNTTDSNGNPLFGALGSALAPFVQQNTPATYTFNGVAGQSSSSTVSIPAALDGEKAFMLKPVQDGSFNVTYATNAGQTTTGGVTLQPPPAAPVTGNDYQIQFAITGGVMQYTVTQLSTPAVVSAPVNYTSGTPITFDGLSLTVTGTPASGDTLNVQSNTSIFGVMDKAISDIGGATSSLAASQAVGQALSNIDISINHLQAARGVAGDLMNRSDVIGAAQTANSTQAEKDRTNAQDVDLVQATSDFTNQQTGFSAALKSYAQIQQLSLFSYIQ